jgi:hypothetical protein
MSIIKNPTESIKSVGAREVAIEALGYADRTSWPKKLNAKKCQLRMKTGTWT